MAQHAKCNSIILFSVCTIVIFVAVSCSQAGISELQDIQGTDGLEMSYLQNYPPEQIKVSNKDTSFGVTVQARNAGTYANDKKGLNGYIFLSGFDQNIISFTDGNGQKMEGKFLEKASRENPNGGTDLFDFKGTVDAKKLLTDVYSFNLLATSCYEYQTKASPSVCIDPNPSKEGDKACTISTISLSSQGAPIAVTNIEEDVLAERIQFRIQLKNVGGGRAIPNDNLADCDPSNSKVDLRQNFDIVYLDEDVKIGGNDGTSLACRPKNDDNSIRLIAGEGFIICTLDKTDEITKFSQGYTTPLSVQLRYNYMNSIQQPVKVAKIE